MKTKKLLLSLYGYQGELCFYPCGYYSADFGFDHILFDKNSKEIAKSLYPFEVFSNGYYAVCRRVNNRLCYTLYNSKGKILLENAEKIRVFDNGWFCLDYDKGCGHDLYDENGELLESGVDFVEVYANGWHNIHRGKVSYGSGRKNVLYNSRREVVITSLEFDSKEVKGFHVYANGWYKVAEVIKGDTLSTLYKPNGEIVVSQARRIDVFANDCYRVDNKLYHADGTLMHSGVRQLTLLKNGWFLEEIEDYYRYAERNAKCNLIDAEGKKVISNADEITFFNNCWYSVIKGYGSNKATLYNEKREIVAQKNSFNVFSNNWYAVGEELREGELFNLYKADGTLVFSKANKIRVFRGDFFAVRLKEYGDFVLYNSAGEVVITGAEDIYEVYPGIIIVHSRCKAYALYLKDVETWAEQIKQLADELEIEEKRDNPHFKSGSMLNEWMNSNTENHYGTLVKMMPRVKEYFSKA